MIPYRRRQLTLHGRCLYIALGWEETCKELGITRDSDWLSISSTELLSISRVGSCCYKLRVADGTSVYFKRYLYPVGRYKTFLQPSKAAIENFGFNVLKKIGIPAPEVIALGESRRFGILDYAIIITKEIKSTMSLEEFAETQWINMPADEKQTSYCQISGSLIHQLRKAHKYKFYHYDLKWRNILIRSNNDTFETVWIDCPRARISIFRSRRNVIVDISSLARLCTRYFSKTEQLRMLNRYSTDGRNLMRAVSIRLSKREPRHQKRHSYSLPQGCNDQDAGSQHIE